MSKVDAGNAPLVNIAVFSFTKAASLCGTDTSAAPPPATAGAIATTFEPLAAAFVFSPANNLGVSKTVAGNTPAARATTFQPAFAFSPQNRSVSETATGEVIPVRAPGTFLSVKAPPISTRVATPSTPAMVFRAPAVAAVTAAVSFQPLATPVFSPKPPVAGGGPATSAASSSPFGLAPAKNLGVSKAAAAATATPPAFVGVEAFSFAKATAAGAQPVSAPAALAAKPPFRPALAFSPTPAAQRVAATPPPNGRASQAAPFQVSAARTSSPFAFSPAKPVGVSKTALASAAADKGPLAAAPGAFLFARGSPIAGGPSATPQFARKRAAATVPAPAATPVAAIPEGSEVVHVRNAGSVASNGDYIPTAMRSGAGRPVFNKVGGKEALYWDAEFGGRWRLYAGDGSGLYSCYTASDNVPTARWKVGAFGVDPAPTVAVTPAARAGAGLGAGGPPAAKKVKVPTDPPTPQGPYAEQLKKLTDMGLGGYGDELLGEMLARTNGSVGGVVTTLMG